MKKYLYFFVCFFVFFLFSDLVYATDITRYNTCTGTVNNSFDTSCDDKNGSYNTNPSPKKDKITKTITIVEEKVDDCGKKVPYNIVLLLDVSSSMRNDNKSSYTVSAVSNMLDALFDLKDEVNIKIKICKFGHSSFGCSSGWVDNGNKNSIDSIKPTSGNYFKQFSSNGSLTDEELDAQATYIQYGLYEAGKELNKATNKNAPMVILITDGYPTKANSGVINSDGISDASDALLNMTSSRYVYYTVKQLIDLKTVLDNKAKDVGKEGMARILTFNVNSIMQNDSLSNFLLNPNATTKDALQTDSNKESYTLYSMLNGVEIYEAFAGLWSYEDYGVYRGVYDSNNSTITFTIPSKAYSSVSYSSNLDLRLFITNPQKSNNNVVDQIKINDSVYCDDNDSNKRDCSATPGNNFKRYSVQSDVVTNCLHNGTSCQNGAVKIVVYLDKNGVLEASKFSSFDIPNNLVYYSFSGNVEKFQSLFPKAVSGSICEKTTSIEVETETIEDEVQKYEYDNCMSKNTSIGNLYYKTDYVYYGRADKTDPKAVGTCVKASGTLDYIMTEDLIFNVGTLKDTPSIYAGGGFSWSGTKITNNIAARFKYLYTDNGTTKPVFTTVNLSVYDVLGRKVTKNYIGISELYTNSTCTTPVTINGIKSQVMNAINGNITDDSTSTIISNSFETLDSNDASKLNDKISFSVNKESNSLSLNETDLVFSRKLTYTLLWYKACLSKDGKTVSYTNGDCDSSKQIDGGALRYTPLKFAKSSFDVNISGNYSSVEGIQFNVKASCPVNVDQILYECTAGDCGSTPDKLKISYVYRSIDHTNPFPKAGSDASKISLNWREFMTGANKINNINRLNSSYNSDKLNYSYSFDSGNLNSIANGNAYSDWSNIDANGYSEFVNAMKKTAVYCPLGKFSTTCD